MQAKDLFLYLLLALLLGAAPGAQAAEYFHPTFKKGERSVRKVLLMPPGIDLMKSGIKGGESMLRENDSVGYAIAQMVNDALRANGFTVVQTPFTPQRVREDHELMYAAASLQNRYNMLQPKLHKQPGDLAKGRFSLGETVADFGPAAATDALVFIRCHGTTVTAGKKAFGLAVATPVRSKIALSIALVDARSGDILFLTKTSGSGNFVNKTDAVLAKRITNALKKLRPPATPPDEKPTK